MRGSLTSGRNRLAKINRAQLSTLPGQVPEDLPAQLFEARVGSDRPKSRIERNVVRQLRSGRQPAVPHRNAQFAKRLRVLTLRRMDARK